MRRNLFYLCRPNKGFKRTLSESPSCTHHMYVERCFVRRWYKLVVPLPWETFCLHSVPIAWLPLSAVVRFETEVFPHNGDTTGWRYNRDSLASILHVVTQFAHARNWLGGGHLKLVNLENTSYRLINRLTITDRFTALVWMMSTGRWMTISLFAGIIHASVRFS